MNTVTSLRRTLLASLLAFTTGCASAGGGSGASPGGDISVSVDGGALSTTDALRNIPATTVKEVRYLGANDAAQRYGVRANSGPVILVTQR